MYVQSKRRSKGKMETRTLLETHFAFAAADGLSATPSARAGWIKAPAGSYFDIVLYICGKLQLTSQDEIRTRSATISRVVNVCLTFAPPNCAKIMLNIWLQWIKLF
jgi:hypothetical protein